MTKLWNRIRWYLHLVNFKSLLVMYTKKHYGELEARYVERNYEKIAKGIPIGDINATIVFINYVESVKEDFLNGKIK